MGDSMKIGIWNLHKMCENNTLFLSRAWHYFQLNGHTVVFDDVEADLVFVGGCVVTDAMRNRCEEKILSGIQSSGVSQYVVFGCLAAFPETLHSFAVCYPDRLHIIPYSASNRLDELIRARIPFDSVRANRLIGHISYQPRVGSEDSFVLISQGCIHDCSYCNIKKVKGKIRSRGEEEIKSEVLALHRSGIRTVTLLADDCGSYGFDQGTDLPSLIGNLSRAAPDVSYKLYTVFPSLFLECAARLEPFFKRHCLTYVCLPMQSASGRILSLMNRHYDPESIAETLPRLRVLDPNLFLYSHFIYNFPTETWKEFEQSVAFARYFDSCVFIGYGENEKTRAAAIFPKCTDEMLQAKTRYLQESIKREELSGFVVPST